MKAPVILSTLALAAHAIVIPDASVFNEIKLEDTHRDRLSWLEDLPSKASHSVKENYEHYSSEASNAIHNVKESVNNEFENILEEEPELRDAWDSLSFDQLMGDDDTSPYTIYELISKCDKTSNFSKLVDKYDHVVKLLNGTKEDVTLFVPIDKAFEDIPKHEHDKPSDEFIEKLLRYHVGIGNYPAGRILSTHTLPTALNEPWLGDMPQRLRTSVGFTGVRVNVYSKVVAADFKAKNGVIHAVNKILIPPTMIGREISLFPAQFSTLLLAYEKTDFVKFIHNVPMIGSTVFAPANQAWERLGLRANAFLFNTDKGKRYLKALLKYQIVANTTLYTDEVYYGDEKHKKTKDAGHQHFELKTLLDNKSLGVDIHSWKGFVSMVVNGYAKVGFTDAIGKNGVIQIVERVPLPPCRKGQRKDDGEISVEDLMERLDEYVVEEDEGLEEVWVGEL